MPRIPGFELDSIWVDDHSDGWKTIKRELRKVDTLGLEKPKFEQIENCDLTIWEKEGKCPDLQPKGGFVGSNSGWMVEDEYILFQQYVSNIWTFLPLYGWFIIRRPQYTVCFGETPPIGRASLFCITSAILPDDSSPLPRPPRGGVISLIDQ